MEDKKLHGSKRSGALTSQVESNGGEKTSERFETYCCGQLMRSLGFVDFLDWNTDSIQRWVCEVCGHGIDLVHYNFDELELQNELDLYERRSQSAVGGAPIVRHLTVTSIGWRC